MKSTIACFLIVLGIPSFGFANCPSPQTVTYGCEDIVGQQHCNWSAPWYEGFPEAKAKPGDHALRFLRVFWGTQDGTAPKPGALGSTECFYLSPYSKIIKLTQNSWGQVPFPTNSDWYYGFWGLHLGRSCNASVSACQFAYP